MANKELWYELWIGADGNIWGSLTPACFRQLSSQRRGYNRYEGKQLTLYVLSCESREIERKMAYAWGKALLSGNVRVINFNKD